MEIKISSITNNALLSAANNANTNVKDEKIDDIELVKFQYDADAVWRSHECTSDEYKQVFGFYPNVKYEAKEGRLAEIEERLRDNSCKLSHVSFLLRQNKIDYQAYAEDRGRTSNTLSKTCLGGCLAGLLGAGAGFLAYLEEGVSGINQTKFEQFIGNNCGKFALAGLGFLAVGLGVTVWQNQINGKKPEVQKEMREYYQKEFNRLIEENRQLTVEYEKLSSKNA